MEPLEPASITHGDPHASLTEDQREDRLGHPRERETTEPVALCTPAGRLNRAALGYTRTRLIDTSRIGRGAYGWGRNKRWEYWALVTERHVVSLTISALDYATLSNLWVLDRATLTALDTTAITPLWAGTTLPGTLGSGPARARTRALALAIDEEPGATRLRARTDQVRLDVRVERPLGHQALGVVVPWSDRLFQYTVKDVGRPVRGRLSVGGRATTITPGTAFAVLDHGRGRWPYSMVWNWGAGFGQVGGHGVGIQLGGKWTQGTGSTENALFVDGRMYKISEELTWDYDIARPMEPWRIHGRSADVTVTPWYDKASRTDLGVIRTRGNQVFGTFSGWLAPDAGPRVGVDGATGWVEEVANRW